VTSSSASSAPLASVELNSYSRGYLVATLLRDTGQRLATQLEKMREVTRL